MTKKKMRIWDKRAGACEQERWFFLPATGPRETTAPQPLFNTSVRTWAGRFTSNRKNKCVFLFCFLEGTRPRRRSGTPIAELLCFQNQLPPSGGFGNRPPLKGARFSFELKTTKFRRFFPTSKGEACHPSEIGKKRAAPRSQHGRSSSSTTAFPEGTAKGRCPRRHLVLRRHFYSPLFWPPLLPAIGIL